jgi:acetolactate synthase small subunit
VFGNQWSVIGIGGEMANKKKSGLSTGNGGIVIGGNVTGSNIVQGNNNIVTNQTINLTQVFGKLYQEVDENPKLTSSDKEVVKAELADVKTALESKQPDETFLERKFRVLKSMAPDIVDVAMETLKNPISGVAEVIKKVASKMKEDAK